MSWSNYKYDTLVCTALKIKASTRSILRKSFVFIYKSYNKWRILSDNRLATIALATNHTLGLYIHVIYTQLPVITLNNGKGKTPFFLNYSTFIGCSVEQNPFAFQDRSSIANNSTVIR